MSTKPVSLGLETVRASKSSLYILECAVAPLTRLTLWFSFPTRTRLRLAGIVVRELLSTAAIPPTHNNCTGEFVAVGMHRSMLALRQVILCNSLSAQLLRLQQSGALQGLLYKSPLTSFRICPAFVSVCVQLACRVSRPVVLQCWH